MTWPSIAKQTYKLKRTIAYPVFQVETTGTKLLAGFADGVVRLLALNKVDPSQLRTKKSKQKFELNLEQVFKPHTKAVNVMAIDEQGELLATGVILDCLRSKRKKTKQ